MKIDLNQILESLNKLDIKFRYAIFIGILLSAALIDFFVIMTFQWSSIWKMEKDAHAMQENIDHLQSDIQRIDQIKAGLQKNRKEFDAIDNKVRPIGEISSIVEDMSSLANEVGLKINQLTPLPENQKELVSSETTKYYTLPIVIQAASGYHMFGRFLNHLELGRFLFLVSGLSVEDRGGEGSQQFITANLKIVLSDKNMDGQKK